MFLPSQIKVCFDQSAEEAQCRYCWAYTGGEQELEPGDGLPVVDVSVQFFAVTGYQSLRPAVS